jgi:hypothetical protein
MMAVKIFKNSQEKSENLKKQKKKSKIFHAFSGKTVFVDDLRIFR